MSIEPQDASDGARPLRWYVCAVAPCRENEAVAHLAQFTLAFNPVTVRSARRGIKGKVCEVTEPMFRGYVFVALPYPVTQRDWSAVNATRGVHRLLAGSAGPLAMPPGTVEQLQTTGPLRIVPKAVKRLHPKQQVRVTNGPFANLVATVVRLEPKARVTLLLRMLGTEREIVLPVNVLERT